MAIYRRYFAYLLYFVFFLVSLNAHAQDNFILKLEYANQRFFAEKQTSIGSTIEKTKSNFPNDSTFQNLFPNLIKGRLFDSVSRGGSWANQGSTDISNLLLASGWLIDYDKKKIYKIDEGDSECNQRDADGYLLYYTTYGIGNYDCAFDALIARANLDKGRIYVGPTTYTSGGASALFKFYDNNMWYNDLYTVQALRRLDNSDTREEIEIQNKELINIIFGDIELVKTLSIAGNEFEKTNNKPYQFILKKLNNSGSDSVDTIVKPTPVDPNNPDSSSGWSMPSFCDYATIVCDFINWFKEDPDSASSEKVNFNDTEYNHYWTERFPWSEQCPQPYEVDVDINLIFASERFHYSFDYSNLCQFLYDWRPYVHFLGFIAAAFIVAGVRNG